ncbi:Hypothetical protein I5071_90800 [Sandaracinus amylolyticus]|nr:Hypothetical protein I5071_90800 [Sandaracinus amylolyticus]
MWFAMLCSQLVYVALLAIPLVEVQPTAPDDTTLALLICLAIGCAIASFLVPPFLLRSAIERHRFELREVPDPTAPVGFRGVVPTIREYTDPSAVRRQVSAIAFAPFIVSMALAEAVSAIGLVSAFLGQPAHVWGAFIATGMVLTAIRLPTDATFIGPIERHTGVPVPR